jgi:hypothetical protein
MEAAEYLQAFFGELNRILPVKGWATYDHSIGMGKGREYRDPPELAGLV